jgi:hypothetical protein
MPKLTYNGVSIEVTKTLAFERKNVYTEEGTQYLYTHFHIAIQGVINPQATSYANSSPGAMVPVPQKTPGVQASLTINAIGLALMTPCASLTYTTSSLLAGAGGVGGGIGAVQNITMLQSPRLIPGGGGSAFSVDSRSGPHPVAFNVIEFHSDKTFIVRYEVETWLNECNSTQRKSILANRWESDHQINEQFLTTRTIAGRATFDRQWLQSTAAQVGAPLGTGIGSLTVPDDFRSTFFYPVPVNFQRKEIRVKQTEDGLACDYAVVDEEQAYNLSSANFPNITDLDGYYKYSEKMGANWNLFTNPIPGTNTFKPGLTIDLHVQVWGSNKATRADLFKALLYVAANYTILDTSGNFNPGDFGRTASHLEAQIFLRQRTATLDTGIYADSGRAIFGSTGISTFWANLYYDSIAAGGLTLLSTNGNFINPSPPNDSGTRGTFVERLVAQSLSTICATPTAASTLSTNAIGTRTASLPYGNN